jgi:hypothetical protein
MRRATATPVVVAGPVPDKKIVKVPASGTRYSRSSSRSERILIEMLYAKIQEAA